jgi:hypothetical protein
MSYKTYINNREIQISDIKPIAYTKQINDLSRLDTRQSNFTYNFYAPLTPQNVEAMEYVSFVGSQSYLPYQQNRFDLVDTDTGRHLIFNGIAVVSATIDKGYEIKTVDGIVDFYKSMENKTLTDAGIGNLNHVKKVANIVASWDDTYDYKYILADYNGKTIGSNSTIGSFICADYLVPSARISYLWDRVHDSNGYTYNGAIFSSEKFLNHWMTYPKPIPSASPEVLAISTQTSQPAVRPGLFPYILNPLPGPFSTPEANNTGTEPGWVNILQTGSYRFSVSGTIAPQGGAIVTTLYYRSQDALGQLIEEGTYDPTQGIDIYVNCSAGGKLAVVNYDWMFFSTDPINGDLETTLALVVGYNVNFDQALIEFTERDFVNEMMQHYGLTAFKDKHRKHIEYLTLEEILQNPQTMDWSDKFSGRTSEKYIFGNYGKRSAYKYRYNDENATHNNGYLTVNNENLKDEVTILSSKIYSPEINTTLSYLNTNFHVYKIWQKNPKEDGTIEYQGLAGRFYYMRSQMQQPAFTLQIYSETLNELITYADPVPVESYYRLPLQQVLADNYGTIESLLFKAKTLEAYFDLSAYDVEVFDFKKLIFVKQLGSYYLVNRIMNFIKHKLTKCEIIEVDYFREIEVVTPPDLYLNITSFDVTGCTGTFNADTNIPQPCFVSINIFALTPDGTGAFYFTIVATAINVTMSGGVITHVFTEAPPTFGAGYQFQIVYTSSAFETVSSTVTDITPMSNSCYTPPPATLTYINIYSVVTVNVSGGYRTIRVYYTSDLSVATMSITLNAVGGLISFPPNTSSDFFATQNGYIEITVIHQNILWGGPYAYSLNINGPFGVISNTANSLI